MSTTGDSNDAQNKEKKSPSNILVMRHGERVDNTFPNWLQECFTEDGKYIRKDLNMPISLPARQNIPKSFEDDTILTNVGVLQAKLVGEALAKVNIPIKYAYCSPALRCVQTCHNVLTSLGINDKLPIKVEPALLEWLKWYISYPQFMTDDELIAAGYNIDKTYKPLISREKLENHLKENIDQYYRRHFEAVKKFLKDNEEKDEGYILIVAHASSLDTCSRQLIGLKPRTEENLDEIEPKIYYCNMLHLQRQDSKWKFNGSPIPSVTHSDNHPIDYAILTD